VDVVAGVEVGVEVGVVVVATAADEVGAAATDVGAATTRATMIDEASSAIRADEWAAAGFEPARRIRLLLR
jgi:hypothetical protein